MRNQGNISFSSTPFPYFSILQFWVKHGLDLIFSVAKLSVFKKCHSHKISTHQQLKAILVGNFLNVLTVTGIILMVSVMAVALANHLRHPKLGIPNYVRLHMYLSVRLMLPLFTKSYTKHMDANLSLLLSLSCTDCQCRLLTVRVKSLTLVAQSLKVKPFSH